VSTTPNHPTLLPLHNTQPTQLLYAHNIDLASQAAEAVTCLGESHPQDLVAEGAIEGLVELLRECAEHARAAATASGGSSLRRRSATSHQSAVQPPPPLYPSGIGPLDSAGSGGIISTEAAAEAVAATAWGPGAAAAPSAAGPRPRSGSSSRRNSSGPPPVAPNASPLRRTRGPTGSGSVLIGRMRPRMSVQGSLVCLVCSSDGHDSCGFCPMSSALKGLLRILAPEPSTQLRFVSAGGVALLFELMMPEVGRPHSRLMQSLVSLLAVALAGGCSEAQDEVRAAGGVEVLVAALSSMARERPPSRGAGGSGAEGFTSFDIYQLRFSILNALTLTIAGNPANKVAFREQAGFVPLVALLRQLLAARGGGPRPIEDGEHLESACLQLLAACLPDSLANQDAACKMGLGPLLLGLLCGPNAINESPQLRLLAASCLGLMLEQQPAVAEEAVAAGVVHALMTRLMQGPTEEEEQVSGRSGCRLY